MFNYILDAGLNRAALVFPAMMCAVVAIAAGAASHLLYAANGGSNASNHGSKQGDRSHR